jgi:RNA polymerase sigma-70 factor (ECF subfamily)
MDGVGGIEAPASPAEALVAECLGPGMRQRLLAFARRFVTDASEAEDVVQEVLLHAGDVPPHIVAIGRTNSWLLRICRHLAIDHARSRRVRRAVWAPMPDDAREWARPERHRPLPRSARRFLLKRRAPVAPRAPVSLRDLPAHSRLLMSLYYEKGYSQSTICSMTGLSMPVLRVRLFRARGTLMEQALRPRPGRSDTRNQNPLAEASRSWER